MANWDFGKLVNYRYETPLQVGFPFSSLPNNLLPFFFCCILRVANSKTLTWRWKWKSDSSTPSGHLIFNTTKRIVCASVERLCRERLTLAQVRGGRSARLCRLFQGSCGCSNNTFYSILIYFILFHFAMNKAFEEDFHCRCGELAQPGSLKDSLKWPTPWVSLNFSNLAPITFEPLCVVSSSWLISRTQRILF